MRIIFDIGISVTLKILEQNHSRLLSGFHLGVSSRWGARIVLVFLSAKNNLVLINAFILGGSGGMLPQGKFLTAETASRGI